jgi:hypothetical protein
MKRIVPFFLAAVLFASCEKEITVDLPETDPFVVVEGSIEPGRPPIIMLTRTQGYFEPTDQNSFAALFVHDANVVMSDGVNTITLQEVCSSSLTEEEIALIAEITGIDPEVLTAVDVCAYTTLDPLAYGVTGRTYRLDIQANGKTLHSVTSIPNAVPLDSAWFKLAQQNASDDTLGYVWATLHDPDTLGNGYRFLARRINHYADGSVKDDTYIGALGSSFYDKYINGLTFDFFAVRGRSPYSSNEDDENDEAGKFKVGDTVVVKFISIGYKEYDFYTSMENNVASAGDLFSTPANVKSNIDGGLGIWAGWGPTYDTVICQ